MFIKPMMACPNKGLVIKPGEWAGEEKFDGIRVCVEVGYGPSLNLFDGKPCVAYTRYGNTYPLPPHIIKDLQRVGRQVILDGELYAPGKRSYGTKALVNQKDLVLAVFGILEIDGTRAYDVSYDDQRKLLSMLPELRSVQVAPSHNLDSWDDVERLRDEVWNRDGEGLILKRRAAHYQPGKRSKDWIKVKKLQSAVLTVIGFEASRGEVFDRGRFATVVVKDHEGMITTVKTRNDQEVKRFEDEWRRHMADPTVVNTDYQVAHPDIGRRLCIEYQERTPDGSYRHPRWDRWEDE